MLNLKSQVKNSALPFKRSETGQIQVKSILLPVQAEEDYTIQNLLQKKIPLHSQKKNLNISTVEYPALNKKMIYNDKSLISKKNTNTISSLQTLQVESISKEKHYKGFWTKQSTEISKKLWLPTKTGYVGSRGIISNGCFLDSESISSLKIEKNILLNRNSPKIFFQSSMFSLVDTTVKGGTTLIKEFKDAMRKRKQTQHNMYNAKINKKNGTTNKPQKIEENYPYIPQSKTIMLNPTSKQRKVINDWIASTRKVWNVSLNHINSNKDFIISDIALRDMFVIKKNMQIDVLNQLEWTLRTPKRIREYAVKDLVASFKGGFTRLKKKQIRKFKINSKYRKDIKQTISLPHESSKIINNKLRVCSMDLELKETIKDQDITSNMRLTRIGYNYYVNIPSFKSEEISPKESYNSIVGIDPGENIPFTYYSPNGEYGFIGIGLKEYLLEKYKKIRLIKEKIKNKKKLLKTIKKHENKILNKVDDFQWKTCHWLLKKYNKIIIPSLYVRRCSNERKQLQNDMRHCNFVNRLIYKSCEYKNVEIHHCKEHFTSMTCTKCGSLKTVKDKTVKCNDCNFEIHRDLSGSRNMVIKHLSL